MADNPLRLLAMSDLHLSKKPWQVRRALQIGAGADAVLLAGDLVNDATPRQMELMQRCIAEVLPDTPVFAVAGNHDYPRQPSPLIPWGVWDYPALQNWLLRRQSYPAVVDESGAYAVCMNTVDIIGLNCVSHWRRFEFPQGDQLRWLAGHLDASGALWHIVLCHAPLLVHNSKRSDTAPYLSRDSQLQQIIDAHENIIFLSGHTHVSLESAVACVEWDAARGNLYLNDGSIRPTTRLNPEGKPEERPAGGNVVELILTPAEVTVTGISVEEQSVIFRGSYGRKGEQRPCRV